MRKLGLLLAGLLLIGTTGCTVTKEWVIETAKNMAIQVVDNQIEKFNENTVVPAFAKIEEQLGQKIDQNDDGVWSDSELKTAIEKQVGPAIADVQKVLLEESDKTLGEKLKNLATKEDGFKGLLLLVVAWLCAKFGIKIGPKGLQKLGEILSKKKTPPSEPEVKL